MRTGDFCHERAEALDEGACGSFVALLDAGGEVGDVVVSVGHVARMFAVWAGHGKFFIGGADGKTRTAHPG